MNPDPLRPVDTDASVPPVARPTLPVVPLVIALGVIVGILVAWAVR